MKKFTSTALGGAPVDDDDLLDIFNSELWAVIQAMLSPFDADVEGLVITGCVTTANAGNFDMTAGIVYLNGEFMRIAAVTNQGFTKYISPSTAVNDDRTYGDGTTNTIAVTKGAGLVGSAPGSGQYITIASLTDLDNRRWVNIITSRQVASVFQSTLEALGGFRTEGSGAYLKTKIVSIGDWNMDTTSSILITHGISDYTKIRSVYAIIIDNTGASYTPINAMAATDTTPWGAIQVIGATQIDLSRTNGSVYDSTSYNSTSFNRGFIHIVYEA